MQWNGETRIALPLTRDAKGFVRIPARFNGDEIATLVDSGASIAGLRPSASGAVVLRSGDSFPVNGNSKPAARGLRLQIGPATLTFDAAVVDLPGDYPLLIGSALFMSAVVEMDFDAGRITLTHPDWFAAPPETPLTVRRMGATPTIDVAINDHDERVCAVVDTGSNTGIALPAEVVARFSLPEDPRTNVIGVGADGLRLEAKGLVPLRELRVGDRRHENVSAAPLHPGLGRGCSLLGMLVLSEYRLIFDLRNDRIWFLPRPGPSGPSPTGAGN